MSDFKAKMYQIQSWLTAYSAPPDPLAGLRGLLLRDGREREEEGREGEEREGTGRGE